MKLINNFCFLEILRSCKIYLRLKNGSKENTMAKHPRFFTLLQEGNSVIAVARDIRISRKAVFQIKSSGALLPPGMISKRESGTGAPKKTSSRMDKLLKREETSYPSLTAVQLKNKHHELLHNVSTRTICRKSE